MKPEINISSSSSSKEESNDILQDWADRGVELEGKTFKNQQNGVIGFFIHEKGNPTKMIDIFIKPNLQLND